MRVEGLAVDLKRLLDRDTGPTITLRTVIDSLGSRGFGVLLFILSLPSALPVPAPGYSTPFGILITILGFQMLAGKEAPVLPKWALKRSLSSEAANKIFRAGIGFLQRTEKLIKPRIGWIGSRAGRILISLLVIVMAFLMILPIPLTNTFPAMVIFMIGIGLTERDGLLILLATLAGWLAAAAYAAIFYLVYYLGSTSFEEVKELIRFW